MGSKNALVLATKTSIDDIMSAVLPEMEDDGIPAGYNLVGHVGMLFFILEVLAS